jgi:hypothetical protein
VCTVRYSLAESVYGRADVDTSDGRVCLWLGANVMLEYTYDEAIEFLQRNLDAAARDVHQLRSDLGFVRDQIVTSEVTMSRIYNWDVRRKRETGRGERPDEQQQQQQQRKAAAPPPPPASPASAGGPGADHGSGGR